MTEKQDPPSGLLSKVVRFVRNPTVSWTDLDTIDADRQSEYSKQVLKERIERKRGNDFVRQREFDQLRKLRQRGLAAGHRVEDPAARPSFFHSSLTSSDDRAGTLKKIDEIEAQMSQQWWKTEVGKAPSGPATGSRRTAPESLGPQTRPLDTAAASTEQEALINPGASGFVESSKPPAPEAPSVREQTPDSDSFAAVKALANPGDALHPASTLDMAPYLELQPGLAETFVHHPDLEEAAIRFANGDYDGAEASLKALLNEQAVGDPAQQLEIWQTLFDFYRATGQQDPFDVASIKFAGRFDRSAPLWFSIPAHVGLDEAPVLQVATLEQREFVWNGPPTLNLQNVMALQQALGRAISPCNFIWSRVLAIEPEAVALLASEFSRWAQQKGQVVFVGADVLRNLLEVQTVPGEREQNPEWWRLRMAALRLMGLPDEFEMVALDYCVTYEVSPPSWLPVTCSYRGDSGDGLDAPHLESDGHGRSGWAQTSILGGASIRPPLELLVEGLVGVIEGDATGALDDVALQLPGDAVLRVPCEQLIRIDFLAAGSVLNWAAEQQGRGRVLQFVQLHRLAAVFFNVVGISEYSVVQVRSD